MFDASSDKAAPGRSLPHWRVALFVLFGVIFLFFASQTVGGLVLGIYAALQHWNAAQIQTWLTHSTSAQFMYGLIAEGFMVVGIGFALRWLGWNWKDIGLMRPKLRHLLVGFISVVPYFVFYLILVAILSAIFPTLNVGQKQDIGFTNVHSALDFTLTFIALVILPPIAEEITMRGFLYTGLKKWLPTLVAALVVSVLFGAAHLAEGGDSGPLWIGAVDTFTLSLVLVFLREKTGNLWAGMVLHATKNLIAFASLFLIK